MDNTQELTVLSLCSGYGGLELGLSLALENPLRVVAVEVEAYALALLCSKAEEGELAIETLWPNLKTFPYEVLRERIAILTAGFPCQPFSVAGKRQGKDDPRHLWPHIKRAISIVRPVWVFLENVPGLINLGLREVLLDLEELGYRVENDSGEQTWGLFTAAEVGAPHKRQRLFILAHSQRPERRPPAESGDNRPDRPECEGQAASRLAVGGECMWPAPPGQPQYEWEEPRTIVVENATSGRSGGKSGDALHKGRPASKAGRESVPQDAERGDGPTEPDNQPAGGNGGSEYEWEEPRVVAQHDQQRRHGRADGAGKRQRREEEAGKAGGQKRSTETECEAQSGVGRAANGSGSGLDAITKCPEIKGRWHIGDLCVTEQRLAEYLKMKPETGHRVDRLRLLGNGVVPQQAEKAFRELINAARQ